MAKYVLPIGMDATTLVEPLNKGIAALEEMQTKSKETGKNLNEAFSQGAAAVDKIEQKIKPVNKAIENASVLGKQMGKELFDAFSAKNIDPSKIEKVVASFKKSLADLSTKNKIGIDIDEKAVDEMKKLTDYLRENFDAIQSELNDGVNRFEGAVNANRDNIKTLNADIKNLEDTINGMAPSTDKLNFENELRAANQALNEETALLDANQKQLKEVSNASKDFAKSIEASAKLIKETSKDVIGLNSTFEQVHGDLQPLTTRLGELEDRMYELAFAGKQNTKEFKELQKEAIKMRKTMLEVDAQVDTFADKGARLEAFVQAASGIAAGFAIAQGAAALFGEENEEVEKALLKVNAAMAILQGLQEISIALNKQSALSVLILGRAKTADAVASEAQAAATVTSTVATRGATIATNLFGLALKGLGIGLIIGAILYLVTNWDKLKSSLDKFLPVGKKTGDLFNEIKSIAVGVGTAIFEFLIGPFKILEKLITEGLDAAVDQAKESYNVLENYQKGYEKQSVQNALDHANEQKQIRLDNWDSALKIQEAEGRDTYASRYKWYQNRIKLMKLEGKETKELVQEFNEFQAKKRGEDRKAAEDAAKKAAEDAKKRREDALKKAEEFYKAQNALVLKYTREIAKLTIDAMDDGLAKEQAKIREDAKVRLEDLKAEGAKRADAVKKAKELEIAINEETNRKLKEAENKYNQERIELQSTALGFIADTMEEGYAKEREYSRLNHEANMRQITEQFKQMSELRFVLLAVEAARYKKEQEKIALEQRQNEISLDEEKAVLMLELMQNHALKTEDTERAKQLAILNIQRQAAEKQVQLLLDSGKDQNSVEVLRAKKLVKDFTDAISDELDGKDYKFDLGEFLGISDGLNDKQKEALKRSVAESMAVMKNFTSFMIDNYQQQIDKKQEQIDQTQSEIDDLESRLDEEKQLRENGFANDVELVQQQLDLKKKEKDEQLAQQKDLLDKKKQMQKIQLAMDTAEQLSGLITASVSIYKGFAAAFPIIGIPLAIAMIGTMFGTFVATKAKALQTINDQNVSQFGDGGEIDGPSHAGGGVKYYSNDGKSGVVELEGNEYVTRKSSYKKYKKLVQALNKDDFSGLSIMDVAAMGLFQRLGISYIPDDIDESIDLGRASIGGGYGFGNMDKNIEYMANEKKKRVERWETSTHEVTKRGTKTTRKRK